MTREASTALPPRWAESLLRLLLPPADRDSVSGDLLEEYRESIAPARGRKADRWYVRQVAGYVVRKAWIAAALVGAILVARYLVDSLSPFQYTPGITSQRSAITSDALMATFALGSFYQAWRSEQVRSGVLVAFAAAVLGGALSSLGAMACLALWHDPQTLWAVQNSGGLGEALWFVPLLLIPIGLVTGTMGAIAGRLARAVAQAGSKRHA